MCCVRRETVQVTEAKRDGWDIFKRILHSYGSYKPIKPYRIKGQIGLTDQLITLPDFFEPIRRMRLLGLIDLLDLFLLLCYNPNHETNLVTLAYEVHRKP